MKIKKMIGLRVAVKQDNATLEKNGILLPAAYAKNPPTGVVVSVGQPTQIQSIDVEVGERVCFNEIAGQKIETEDGEMIILPYSAINFTVE